MKFIQFLVNLFDKRYRPNVGPPDRNYNYSLDHSFLQMLQPGDIILYRLSGPKDFPGSVISHMTSSPYNHIEVHVFDGYDISAGTGGVTFIDLYRANVLGSLKVDVLRLKDGLSREQRLIILSKMFQSLLKPYDYIKLIGFPFLKDKVALRRAGNDAYICSELVAWAYKNAGIDLIKGRPESIEAPVDISRSNVLEYVGTFSRGIKMGGDYRNEFFKQETTNLARFVAEFMGLLSQKDEYYRGLYLNKTLLEGEISG